MLKDNNQIVPVAIKKLPYASQEQELSANAELAALTDAVGWPHLRSARALSRPPALSQTSLVSTLPKRKCSQCDESTSVSRLLENNLQHCT